MRILHVRDVANVAYTLVEGLKVLGHDAELLRTRTRGGYLPFLLKGLVVPHRLMEGAAINRYVKQGNFDVVHIHMAYMGMLGVVGRYPYFLHVHGHDIRDNLRNPVMRWPTVTALRSAVQVFYPTPDLAAMTRTVRPDAIFIPNPIDTDRFRCTTPPVRPVPRIYVSFRLEAIKGIDIAVEIARRIKERYPQVEVDAPDWGPLAPRFKDSELIRLVPRIPYDGMPERYNQYDIVIGQFELGAIGMAEMEAMASERPVLSWFNFPGTYDEEPPIFSSRDVDQAVETLSQLIENPELRHEAGRRGREWVVRHHDYRSVAKVIEGHYQRLQP